MNLTKLYETQAALDEHIMQEHPELQGQDNLDWKILALQVELGECANEWRGFKKWSKEQEPRTNKICHNCKGKGKVFVPQIDSELECGICESTGSLGNPLLEEYVDCLHFILSIGLEFDVEPEVDWDELDNCIDDITEQFAEVFEAIGELRKTYCVQHWTSNDDWTGMFEQFYILGKKLGFTWEQIEEAYYAKNKVNHARQESGY